MPPTRAVAAELLAQVDAPGSDLGFVQGGARGISIMTRAALMFVVARALGAIVGRLLPAECTTAGDGAPSR